MSDDVTPKPVIQDLNKIMMFTETPGVEGKRSKLVWSVRDGNPRISVFTNDPKDQTGRGIISAPMNAETFYGFIELFEATIKGPNDSKCKIDSFTSVRDNAGNVKFGEKALLSEVWFGKDEKGLMWISCIADSRPKIKFTFTISDYHRFYRNGQPLTESEASCIQAGATCNILKNGFYPLVAGLRAPNTNQGEKQNTTYGKSNYAGSAPRDNNTRLDDIPF